MDRGYEIIDQVFSDAQIEVLLAHFEALGPIKGGVRNLLDDELVRSFARSQSIRDIAHGWLSESAFCVRAVLFDKTPEHNWNLPFHQDTKVAVRGHHPEFRQSEKDGVPHILLPVGILERQIAIRIQLDPGAEITGPVQVIPNSHVMGILSHDEIDRVCGTEPVVSCPVPLGGALVFRSLLLHGSERSQSQLRRRVLHFEFCDQELPSPLEWFWRL